MTTVSWVKNDDSKYEVSSKEHLLQIMHNGALYANDGTFPSDFLTADFIQTADIDFNNDSTSVTPITIFKGEYDGDNYAIKNYSYIDPEYETTNNCTTYGGLFGYAYIAEIKNIRATGVWTVNGFHNLGGLVVGYCRSTTFTNIQCSFDEGTSLSQDDTSVSNAYIGGIIGRCYSATLYGVSLSGTLGISPNTDNSPYLGGITGSVDQGSSATLLRNDAVFSLPLVGNEVGGITGRCNSSSMIKCINAMEGDMTGSIYAGGIIGYLTTSSNDHVQDSLINSMRGKIYGDKYLGGVIGGMLFETGHTFKTLLNYMSGDIEGTLGAGIIGRTISGSSLTTNTSLVAMNGNVYYSTIITDFGSTVAHIDTSFGLTFTTDHSSTNDALTDLSIDSVTGLPYTDLSGSDENGVVYDWAFVFGNIPIGMEFVEKPLYIEVKFGPIEGAIAYRLTRQSNEDVAELVVASDFTELSTRIVNLSPKTEYTLRLYSTNDLQTYTLQGEKSATTLANLSSNYDREDFNNDDGTYDLSQFNDDSMSQFLEVLNDVFTTGDSVLIPVGSASKKSTFVKLGETTSIVGEEVLLVPFNQGAGSEQSASITLSDTSTVTLTYDETENTIGINGSTYSPGESTIIDQQKVTIMNI